MIPYKLEFIRFNEDLFVINRKYPEPKVKPDKIEELRQIFSCDIVLRKDGMLFFCRKIEDAEIIN